MKLERPTFSGTITFGQFLQLLAIIGAIITGVYQSKDIRATLEQAIEQERLSRIDQTAALASRLAGLADDIKAVRGDIMVLQQAIVLPANRRRE